MGGEGGWGWDQVIHWTAPSWTPVSRRMEEDGGRGGKGMGSSNTLDCT